MYRVGTEPELGMWELCCGLVGGGTVSVDTLGRKGREMVEERETGELTHFSTFSGIEGVGIAAELVGFKSIGQVEINPFSLRILNKRYPDVPKWRDVRNVTKESVKAAGIRTINLISGGFPCQDLSVAGKQAGLEGERSGLWFEMLRVIAELRPRWVIAENVRGAVNLALDTVKMGLEGEGYKVWPFVIPASAFGAPHRRERLFVVGCREDVGDGANERIQRYWTEGEQVTETHAGKGLFVRSGCGVDGMMWATPNCMDVLPSRSFEAMKRQATNGARKNRSRPGNLREQIDPLMHLAYIEASLEANNVPKEQWEEKIAERMGKLWPTSQNRDYKSRKRVDSSSPYYQLNTEVAKIQEGQLNPDWVECLMGFPIGWTNPEVDEPEPWPGWPAPMGVKMWGTHTAFGTVRSKEFIRDSVTPAEFVSLGMEAEQYPYEPPRVAKGIKNRADRIKALGNAVVPQQVYPLLKAISEIEMHL